jgi:hypothetical protein
MRIWLRFLRTAATDDFEVGKNVEKSVKGRANNKEISGYVKYIF